MDGMKEKNADRKSILDLNLAELEDLFAQMGLPKYRAGQVFAWIYDKRIVEWEKMTDLPFKLRERLASQWSILTSRVDEVRTSRDATTKLLIRLYDGLAVESVFIPEGERNTVCLSTQVGCPIRCSFCASGKGGLKRNLSSGEILEQILHIGSAVPAQETIRNVVLMGMGEPMRNYHNVMRAVRAMNAEWGFQVGARRITISTIGDLKGIDRLAGEGIQVNLAISLHGADDSTRAEIVPAKRIAPVESIVEAARSYFDRTRRRVSFEYVLIDGINSSIRQARKLARLLRGFPCMVNLIPMNPVDGVSLRAPEEKLVRAFLRELQSMGIPAAIRRRKGTDISAACGQLAGQKASLRNDTTTSQK